MLCKHPFIRKPAGTVRKDREGRLDATPLPCGRCLHCRINASRIWTHRIMLEVLAHDESLFGTFTYNDDNLPSDWNLQVRTVKNLLRRIRKKVGISFRYFAVGEYGDASWRPHYHIIFFGLGLVHSEILDKCWNYKKEAVGFTSFDEVNKRVASYISGYTIKKLTRKSDPKLEGREPEFMRSSRKEGGIGLPGIKIIAQDLLKSPHWKPTIISELQHGKQQWPLGRYLTNKLNELQGIPERDIERRLDEYQQKIFDDCMKGGFYYDNILKEKKQKRRQQQWRHDNFKREKRL